MLLAWLRHVSDSEAVLPDGQVGLSADLMSQGTCCIVPESRWYQHAGKLEAFDGCVTYIAIAKGERSAPGRTLVGKG